MKAKLRGLDHYEKEFLKGYSVNPENPKILGVSISTSEICNYRCVYCYAGDQKPKEGELTLDEQKWIISQAAELGAKTVVICGNGEPTMDKKLLEIVASAHSFDMYSIVVTNAGIFGDDELANRVFGMDGESVLKNLYDNDASLIVKSESLNEDTYDYIVGVKGAFKKFLKAIERIKSVGFNNLESTEDGYITRIAFSAVIMKNNINDLTKLKDFADEMGAQFICKLPSLVGRALENIDNMFEVSRYEEIRKHLFGYTAKRETLMVDTPKCMAWHYGPCIDCYGEIRECYTSACPENNRIGNIRETPLKELVKRKYKQYDISACDFCPVKTRINKEFEEKGLEKLWKIKEDGDFKDKIQGF